jgi:hypothetical protein
MNTANTDFTEVPDTGSLKTEVISAYKKMSLDVSVDLFLLATLRPWGRLGRLTEMSIRNIPGG